jgi:ABC-2 type transport system permease protein
MTARTLRKIGWFFLRDLAIARSYRVVFLFEMVETLLGVAAFYYLAQFVEVPAFTRAQPAGGYFAFAVVGFAFFDYLSVALNAFDQSLEEARRNGTLEYLLVTQTSLPVILAGSAIYPFVVLSMRTAVYLGWAVLLFNFPVSQANWVGAVLVLAASVLAFAGLGVFSASYSLLFKRGNPVKWLFLGVAGLVSGIMYPVTVLPSFLQSLARLVPVTYSLEGMRIALLQQASLGSLWPTLRALLLFALVLLPVSLAVFSWALRRTKVTGTLTHF